MKALLGVIIGFWGLGTLAMAMALGYMSRGSCHPDETADDDSPFPADEPTAEDDEAAVHTAECCELWR